MKPSDFKVGDRVRVISYRPNHLYSGTSGTVYLTSDDHCYIKGHDGQKYGFPYADTEIELVTSAIDWQAAMISNTNALSPQSPQPQTTQQKEDNMYGIVKFNHASGASGLETKPSEAEAKQLAEQFVATKRGNLTEKQYFSVSIIDLRTGKLIGSVVDAPPAVDWATS